MSRWSAAFLIALWGFSINTASAGYVSLYAADDYCEVIVRPGLNSPTSGPTQQFMNVQSGSHLGSYEDRACWQRSNDPHLCNSGLTPWACCQNLVSGVDNCDVH